MKSFKLNALESKELEKFKGGYVFKQQCDGGADVWCGCGCHYANNNGSSTDANMNANVSTGLQSGGIPEEYDTIPCPA